MAFYFGFLFSTSISQLVFAPLAGSAFAPLAGSKSKALSLGLVGQGSGRGPEHGRGAGESGGLVAAGVCRALGGGGGSSAPPRAAALKPGRKRQSGRLKRTSDVTSLWELPMEMIWLCRNLRLRP